MCRQRNFSINLVPGNNTFLFKNTFFFSVNIPITPFTNMFAIQESEGGFADVALSLSSNDLFVHGELSGAERVYRGLAETFVDCFVDLLLVDWLSLHSFVDLFVSVVGCLLFSVIGCLLFL
jgi:hypothetical protein